MPRKPSSAKKSASAKSAKGSLSVKSLPDPTSGVEEIMRDTIEWLLGPSVPPSERARMEMAENYTFSCRVPAPNFKVRTSETANFEGSTLATLQLGSVETAALLAENGFRPALLNFAHEYNCGGGFDHALGSQEEDIFRKTSIFLSLWPHRRSDDGPGVLKRGMWIGNYDSALERKDAFYPLTECGGIYSPHVRVVRDLTSKDVCLLESDAGPGPDFPAFAVLTVAAQNVNWDPPFKPRLLLQKARTVLWMAASQGHDSVVLGAFGCGYFSNPPDAVADTFAKLLGPGGGFENVFSLVVFAVIHGNLLPFVTRFPETRETAFPSAKRILGRKLVDRCSGNLSSVENWAKDSKTVSENDSEEQAKEACCSLMQQGEV